jgi:error-prone DNA polymerase
LSLKAHPMSFYREQLDRLRITPAKGLLTLPNGAPVRVAGLVILRQRPGTAKGITFVTLEDETGTINLVVHQHTWDRFYRIARRAPAWVAHGHVQTTEQRKKGDGPHFAVQRDTCSRDHGHAEGLASEMGTVPAPVIHVVVSRLEALAEQLRRLDVKSRDFR